DIRRDRHRAPAEPRVVLLLDGGEGAVQVDDQGRRVGGVEAQAFGIRWHAEPMFAHRAGPRGRTARRSVLGFDPGDSDRAGDAGAAHAAVAIGVLVQVLLVVVLGE